MWTALEPVRNAVDMLLQAKHEFLKQVQAVWRQVYIRWIAPSWPQMDRGGEQWGQALGQTAVSAPAGQL